MNAESVSASLFDHRESASHGLVDALELCLLLRDDGRRFDRAIVRYATETAGETVEEAQAVLALLAALRGGRRLTTARTLAELVDRRGLERANEVLIRGANQADGVQRSR